MTPEKNVNTGKDIVETGKEIVETRAKSTFASYENPRDKFVALRFLGGQQFVEIRCGRDKFCKKENDFKSKIFLQNIYKLFLLCKYATKLFIDTSYKILYLIVNEYL